MRVLLSERRGGTRLNNKTFVYSFRFRLPTPDKTCYHLSYHKDEGLLAPLFRSRRRREPAPVYSSGASQTAIGVIAFQRKYYDC